MVEAERFLDSQCISTWEGLHSWIPGSGATTSRRYSLPEGTNKSEVVQNVPQGVT